MAAITTAEIVWRYSVAGAATAGNATAGSKNTTYQGKYMSNTAWAGGVANDLLDDITGAQNAASQVDYVCLFIHNTNGANNYQNAAVAITGEQAGGASVAIAVDTTAQSPAGQSGTPQALTYAGAATLPATAPGATIAGLTYGSTATLGTINFGNCRAFWVRRTAANTIAVSDFANFQVTGDTGAN